MYQQHFRNEMSIENLFSDIDSESDQRHSVNEAIFSENNNKILNIIKWDASSCGSSTLYYPMRNSNEMTIGKTDPTLIFDRFLESSSNNFHEHLFLESSSTFDREPGAIYQVFQKSTRLMAQNLLNFCQEPILKLKKIPKFSLVIPRNSKIGNSISFPEIIFDTLKGINSYIN